MSTTETPEATTEAEWRELADQIRPHSQLYIDGAFSDAEGGKTFATINPATGEKICDVAFGSEGDVDRAVKSARAAFKKGEWANSSPTDRKDVMRRLGDLILEHGDEFAVLDSIDMGKVAAEARSIDVADAANMFHWYGEALDKLYDEIAPTAPGSLALVQREPLGVVGAVIPWNFPLDIAGWKLAPALAAGNSVVLKPAEQSPLSALRLAELASEAGIPAGVLNVVTGDGPVAGQALGRHPEVDCLAFTGSTEIGKRFLAYAAESNMKQVWLECGGKSPTLVFADADLEAAVSLVCGDFVYNQGEVCSAHTRLLVDRKIKAEFLERLLKAVEGVQVGDPLSPDTTMGPLVDSGHTERVLGFIRDPGSAKLVYGGDRLEGAASDCFIVPTIFDQVAPDAKIAQEEVFGPVLSITDFDSEEQAIELANNTIYGLAASVFTDNMSRALRVSQQVRAGTVSVNTIDALSAMTPFGGFGQSGVGRDLSLHALDKYTGLKTTWIAYS